jgi:hypothetical protein
MVYDPAIFYCNIDFGSVASPCDPNQRFDSYAYSHFHCDVVFYEDVTIGNDCATDVLSVLAQSTFNCPVQIVVPCIWDNDGGYDGLNVDAPSEFSCNVYIGDDDVETYVTTGELTQTNAAGLCGGLATTPIYYWERAVDIGASGVGMGNRVNMNQGAVCDPAVDSSCKLFEVYFPAHFENDVSIGDKANPRQIGTNLYVESKSFFHDDIKICSAADVYAGGNVTFGDDNNDCDAYTFAVWNQSTFNCVVTMDGKPASTPPGDEPAVTCGEGRLNMVPILIAKDDVHFECDLWIQKDLFVDDNTTLGTVCTDLLTVNAESTFNCKVIVEGDPTTHSCGHGVGMVPGLFVNIDAQFYCDIWVQNDVFIDENLTVKGSTWLGDECAVDTLTVQAVSDFKCAVVIDDPNATCDDLAGIIPALHVKKDALFNCSLEIVKSLNVGGNVTLGTDCNNLLTVKSNAAFECEVLIDGGSCGEGGHSGPNHLPALVVNADADFGCDLSIVGSLYYCDGGNLEWPCPTGSQQVLLYDSLGQQKLEWRNYNIVTVMVCDPTTGLTTPHNFLTIP